MPQTIPARLDGQRRSEWVHLRTLIVLRWMAIAGQISAITVAWQYFELRFDLVPCVLAVGASVAANLSAIFVYPENKRLSEGELLAMLLFDISQLSVLLYLTGGLHNPFALMILAPVTISATALQMRSILALGAVAIAMITFVAVFHMDLRTADGQLIRMPQIFVFGFWFAITIGIVFEAIYARRVTSEIHSMSDALLATQMALSREQKLTDLGGVVAAAAHELGTPLATIKLASAELMEELQDRPDLREDAELIRAQADRCRDILRSMGQAGKNDLHLRFAPVGALVREAADPHADRGKEVLIALNPGPDDSAAQPLVERRPEIIHGLRNLIQNAVDFAASTVWIDVTWTRDRIGICIQDDGRGFPPHLLGRIGDPFVRKRSGPEDRRARPEYEGMGLGLFIAKTLLERSGAVLTFYNASPARAARIGDAARSGATVELTWPRRAICPAVDPAHPGLGENQPIQA